VTWIPGGVNLLYRLLINLSRRGKSTLLLCFDVAITALSFMCAKVIFWGPVAVERVWQWQSLVELLIIVLSAAAIAFALGVHRIKLNAYQMHGLRGTALTALLLATIGMITSAALSSPTAPQEFVVGGMMFLIASVAGRLVIRQLVLKLYRDNRARRRILIYGAGQTGQQLATALSTDDALQAVAFVDDDRRLQGLTIAGLRVYSAKDIPSIVEQQNIDRIVLAMPSVNLSVQATIRQRLMPAGCEVHILPSFCDLVGNTQRRAWDTHPLDLDAILGRDQLEHELPGVSLSYSGENILITGAGGSIGSELCRQLITCAPRRLVLLDHNELALYTIDRQLRALGTGVEIVTILGSICDEPLMSDVMSRYGINIVLHAAAYKHVSIVEDNAIAGMRNNVLGTKTVAEAARRSNVDRFILVSTDKAVRPKSMMGASKRFAELIVQDLAARSMGTRFSMVRFGNVLGSSGSVIPLFEEQISNGGPVTLTHSDVTRYFMTIAEAVRLVLLAGSFTNGGDVFVLDMGKPVPVRELARRMIEQAGLKVRDATNPDGDIEIEITGLRPGEKLHEELLIGAGNMLSTPHPKIMRTQEACLSELQTAKAIASLRKVLETRDIDLLRNTMTNWIEMAPQKPVVQLVVAE